MIALTSEAELTGLTTDGIGIPGTDSLRTVPGSSSAVTTPDVATTALSRQKDSNAPLNGDASGDPVPLATQQRPIPASPDEPTAFLRRARHNTFETPTPERVDSALADFDEDSLPAALSAALAGRLIA